MLTVNLIGNPHSLGLRRDAEILRTQLESHGATVRDVDMFTLRPDESVRGADINLFLESLHDGRYLRGYASANWLLVNSEYYFPEQWDRHLPLISLVMVKTTHGHNVWRNRLGDSRTLYTSFASRDLHQPGIVKTGWFLHSPGKSMEKGTEAVAGAWRAGIPHPLTVVTNAANPLDRQAAHQLQAMFAGISNVRLLHDISDEQMTIEMNRNRFFLQPSLYEGWGHSLHEALSARAVVLTTDAPPMREFPGIDSRMLIPIERVEPRTIIQWHYVGVQGIRETVERAVGLAKRELELVGDRARDGWETERDRFRETFGKAISQWYSWI